MVCAVTATVAWLIIGHGLWERRRHCAKSSPAPSRRAAIRGTTRPHRATWLVWTLLAVVACLSQRADGAMWSLTMAGAQVISNCLVLVLALRRGVGGTSTADRLLIALAGSSVIGWVVADEPLIATAGVVLADLIAVAMMVPKTYHEPRSETLATFAGASLAGGLAAGAVGALDLALLLYPVYYCLANGAIAVLIGWRRSILPPALLPTAA